jgi:hypothetical protein
MKYIWKVLKYLFLIFTGVGAVILIQQYIKDPKTVEKRKAKAKKKLLDKINKSNDKRRKGIRDKYSSVIRILLIIVFLINICHAEYIVWDKEDKVYRDYGHYTNYIKSLEEEKAELLSNRSNIIYIATNEINNISEPTTWERIDFYVGFSIPVLIKIILLIL